METIGAWFESMIAWLVGMVDQLGVLGIFVMTFLESTFAPIPSEMTMLPAGYLIQQGQMDAASVFIASVLGTIGGAYFNYWLAKRYGRSLFLRYGKYFLMTPEKLEKLERFFEKHGAISTFTGRLIPGIRHYISFPAGLAKMDVRKFVLYTGLGGALWMAVLLMLGYHIGKNKDLMVVYLPMIKAGIFTFVALIFLVYTMRNRRRAKAAALALLKNQKG